MCRVVKVCAGDAIAVVTHRKKRQQALFHRFTTTAKSWEIRFVIIWDTPRCEVTKADEPVLPRTRAPLGVDGIRGDAPSSAIFSQVIQGVKQKILPDRPEPCPSKGFGQPLPKRRSWRW